MGKPQAPAAPDYVGAAQAQGTANTNTAIANTSLGNPNVTTPYGSQTVSYQNTGPNGDPQPYINQSLNPQSQQTLDAQQRVQTGEANLANQGLSAAQGVLGTPFNFSGPGVQTSLNTSGVAPMPVNAGTTGQAALMARLQPQINQSDAALKQQLANQGLTAGGEAYNNAERVQGQQDNDLTSQAALYGLGLDQSANQQGYNQALQTGQFANTASAQNLQQQLGLYNQPLNQITALMSGSQIQNPQFSQYQGSSAAPAPIANATAQQGQYAQGLYGQQMAGYNSMLQGLSNLGGSAMLAFG